MNINLTLLMQAVGFGLFIWFTARFVWPPLMGKVEERRRQIADGRVKSLVIVDCFNEVLD